MIQRKLGRKILHLAKKFPIVAITGPRQSGKTTLAKALFPKKSYVSLEDPEQFELAQMDPRRFLGQFSNGAVLDEIQKAPHLFSYLQVLVDEKKKNGQFVLTGSQNFLLLQSITQSLAGRVALFTLLPFGLDEIKNTLYAPRTIEESMFTGFYPKLFDASLKPQEWFPNYVQTYVERDVRQLQQVQDLPTFQKFLRLCAARSGQILNISDLASDCALSPNTVKAWLNVLETSYVIYRLQPYFKNFNKRLIKAPKLYLWDSGLACYLLGIKKANDLRTHHLRGALFETWVVGEFMKQFFHAGLEPSLYYWRDKKIEIDLLLDRAGRLTPFEIKSAQTLNESLFASTKAWCKIARQKPAETFLIYAGKQNQDLPLGRVRPWQDLPTLT